MGYTRALTNIDARSKMKDLGARISQLIEETGISYRQIFLATGVDYNSIKKIEKGMDVKHSTYLKVLKFLEG